MFVADSVADVADDAADRVLEKPNGNNGVADVADVALLHGDGRSMCAQCNAPNDLIRHGAVWLHKECVRFWLREHEGSDGIPPFLDRRVEARS